MKIGFLGMLALIFITLKLTGYIMWSWVWVLAPLWGGFILGLVIMFIVVVFAAWEKTSRRNIRRP
jgi:hypothetical protein